MGFISTGASAIGKLIAFAILAAAFLFGMASVVYMSLSGTEVKVPEVVGKDFVESEKELAALGLKIKRRADRPSAEKMNTVLEQLPKPGETVKTGQLILVVVSSAGEVKGDIPKSLQKDVDSDDTKKIEDMITDKPKRSRSNSNSNANTGKKLADTTRDVISNTASNTSISVEKSDQKAGEGDKKAPVEGDRPNEGPRPGAKPQATPNSGKKPDGKTSEADQRRRLARPQ